MPYTGDAIEDYVIVNGIDVLHTQASHIRISQNEPNTYALAISEGAPNCVAKKDFGRGNVLNSDVAATPSGRQTQTNPVTGGLVLADGTANWWSITDEVGGRLLAHGALATPKAVFSGYQFSLAAFLIKMPAQ